MYYVGIRLSFTKLGRYVRNLLHQKIERGKWLNCIKRYFFLKPIGNFYYT